MHPWIDGPTTDAERRAWTEGHHPEDHAQSGEVPSEWLSYIDGLAPGSLQLDGAVIEYPESGEPRDWFNDRGHFRDGELLPEGVDEPEGDPDEIGPTPRWFIIAFSLFVLACGLCSVLGAIAYFAGWIG